jgi:hypothetical protein
MGTLPILSAILELERLIQSIVQFQIGGKEWGAWRVAEMHVPHKPDMLAIILSPHTQQGPISRDHLGPGIKGQGHLSHHNLLPERMIRFGTKPGLELWWTSQHSKTGVDRRLNT